MLKIYLFVIFTFFSAYGLSGINYESFIRKNKIAETRILFVLTSLIMGYLLACLGEDIINIVL